MTALLGSFQGSFIGVVFRQFFFSFCGANLLQKPPNDDDEAGNARKERGKIKWLAVWSSFSVVKGRSPEAVLVCLSVSAQSDASERDVSAP